MLALLLTRALLAAGPAPAAATPAQRPPAIRLIGHGVALDLRPPFQVTRPKAGPAVEPDLLMGAHQSAGVLQNFMVAQPRPGHEKGLGSPIAGTPMRLVLPDPSLKPQALGVFEPGPALPRWELELGGRCRLIWPDGYALAVQKPDAVEFRMAGFGPKQGSELVLAGPFAKAPDPDVLAPKSETMFKHGDLHGVPWAELRGTAGGKPSAHRVYYLPLGGGAVFVEEARAPAEQASATFADADALARDFMACRH